MGRFLYAILTLLMAGGLFGGRPATLLRQTLKISVNDNTFGSGTVIGYRNSKPLVRTCAHVVNADDAKIVVDGHPAHLFMIDLSVDLAVVILDQHVIYPVATLASLPPDPGDEEIVVGYPLAREETIVHGYFGRRTDDVVTEGSAPVYPGNSGGGAYTWHFLGGWQLAGVADAVAIGQFGLFPYLAPNVSFTVSSDVMRAFLKRLELH